MVLKFGEGIAAGGAGLIGLGGLVLGPILGAMIEAAKGFNEVRKAADQLGSTTEIVSGLAYAAKSAGVDLDGFVQAGQHLGKLLSEAAEGGNASADAFARLGLDANELIKLPLDEQFNAIADAIAGLPNQADQARAAMELLGKSGKDMLPALRGGSAGLEKFKKTAEDVGAIVSTENAENAKKFTSALTQMKQVLGSIVEAIGADALGAAADPLKEFATVFVQIAKAVREFIEENKGLVVGVAAVAAGVIAAGAVVVGIGLAFTVAATAAGGFGAALAFAGTVLAAIASPLGLIVATVAVAGVMLAALVADFGDLEFIGRALSFVWRGVLDTFTRTWSGIKAALAAGDLKLAFEVAVAGLDVVWKGFLLGVQIAWDAFKGSFVDGWHQVILSLRHAWIDFTHELQDTWIGAIAMFAEATGDEAAYANAGRLANQSRRERQKDHEIADAQEKLAQAARDAARAAGNVAAAMDLAAAQAKLAAKQQEAENKRTAQLAGQLAFWGIDFATRVHLGQRQANALQGLSVAGQFGSNLAAQAFGASSAAKNIEKNTKDTADGVKRLEQKVGGVPVD